MLILSGLMFVLSGSLLVASEPPQLDDVILTSLPIPENENRHMNTNLLLQIIEELKGVKETQITMLEDISTLKQDSAANQAKAAELEQDFQQLETNVGGIYFCHDIYYIHTNIYNICVYAV